MSSDVQVVEKAGLEIASLRGDAAIAAAVRDTLGLDLPQVPNTVARGPAWDALWLGPDEWLIVSAQPREATLESLLRPPLADRFATVVDLSSGYKVFELGGAGVRDALAAGCPLDIHASGFGPGQCAQSHFFKAAIVLRPTAAEGFQLIVRSSFADYTLRLLLDR